MEDEQLLYGVESEGRALPENARFSERMTLPKLDTILLYQVESTRSHETHVPCPRAWLKIRERNRCHERTVWQHFHRDKLSLESGLCRFHVLFLMIAT
jgi:hypothetical protein